MALSGNRLLAPGDRLSFGDGFVNPDKILYFVISKKKNIYGTSTNLGTLLLVAIGVYHPGYHAKNEKIQFKNKIMKHINKKQTTLDGRSEPKSVA